MKKIIIAGILFVFFISQAFAQTTETSIIGTFSQLGDQDSVSLMVYKYGDEFGLNILELKPAVFVAHVHNHQFQFTIKNLKKGITACRLIVSGFPMFPIDHFIIEGGDHVKIAGNDSLITTLSGSNAEKLRVWFHTNKIIRDNVNARSQMTMQGLPRNIRLAVVTLDSCNKYLNQKKPVLGKEYYQQLKAYIDRGEYGWILSLIQFVGGTSSVHFQAVRDTFIKYSVDYQKGQTNDFYTLFNADTLKNICVTGFENKFILDRFLVNEDFAKFKYSVSLTNQYEYVKSNFQGNLREKFISYLLLSHPRANDIKSCYNDALKYITDETLKTTLTNHCTQFAGTPAYNFSLLDTNGTVHHLPDYKGKILVLDFWFVHCPNCVELTPKLKLVEDLFKDNPNVVFISVCSDYGNYWKTGIKTGLYTTSAEEINLSPGPEGQSAPFYQKINFTGAPTLKLIDKNGNWCENPVDCRQDDGKDLIAKIEKALTN